MASGSLPYNRAGKGDIRKNSIKTNLVDCIVA